MINELFKGKGATVQTERITTQQTDNLFAFKPNSVDDLAAELRAPKQPFDLPRTTDGDYNLETEPTDTEVKKLAAESAGQVIDLIDGCLSFSLSLIDKSKPNVYRLAGEERRMLRPHLTKYLQGKSVDIPPGIMLTIIIIAIYAPKVMEAIGNRKQTRPRKEKSEKVIENLGNTDE